MASVARQALRIDTGVDVAQAARNCTLRVIVDRAGFEALEAEWNALFERAGRPAQVFQDFNFLWHWANHYLKPGQALAIVTGWTAGRLVMVWPLLRTKVYGIDRLSWMGQPVSQYGDVLIEPGLLALPRLIAGWTAVKALGADIAVLRKVRLDAAVTPILAEAGLSTASTSAPFLDMTAARSFEDVQKHFSAKARSDRRRLMRRLEDCGPVTIDTAPEAGERRALVARAFMLKREALGRRGRLAPTIDDPAMEAFFQAALADSKRPVGAVVDALLCGGRPIGVALSFCCKGECFGHILAHDVAFNKQGAGAILAEQAFRAALARGMTRFDMLAPTDAFKSAWASGTVAVEDWAVPLKGRGWLFYWLWLVGGRIALKRCLDRAPPWLGQTLRGLLRALRR